MVLFLLLMIRIMMDRLDFRHEAIFYARYWELYYSIRRLCSEIESKEIERYHLDYTYPELIHPELRMIYTLMFYPNNHR